MIDPKLIADVLIALGSPMACSAIEQAVRDGLGTDDAYIVSERRGDTLRIEDRHWMVDRVGPPLSRTYTVGEEVTA